jgi:hypothetical protein
MPLWQGWHWAAAYPAGQAMQKLRRKKAIEKKR